MLIMKLGGKEAIHHPPFPDILALVVHARLDSVRTVYTSGSQNGNNN